MALSEQQTLFPGDDFPNRFAPLRLVAADWFTSNSNSTHEILDIGSFSGQLLDINRIGALSQANIDVVVETERNRQRRGVVTDTAVYETEALPGLNAPIDEGPIATDGLSWSVANRANVNQVDPYKAFLNYDIRNLTVLDKLRLGIPLNDPVETDLATRDFPGQDFTLQQRENLSLPPERDPVYHPNLAEKIVLEEETSANTLDLTSGSQNTVVEETVDVFRGQPQDVIYLTGIGGNWQESATDTEDVTLNIGTSDRKIMEIKTLGLPGMSGTTDNESFPPYFSEVHIPFLNEMDVWLTCSSDINNIDVQVEYARVDRTLIEKAMYGLEGEIEAPQGGTASERRSLHQQKQDLYDLLRDKMRAGLPIEIQRQRIQEENPNARA